MDLFYVIVWYRNARKMFVQVRFFEKKVFSAS